MPIDAPSANRPVIVVLDASPAVRKSVELLLRVLAAQVEGFETAREFLAAIDRGLMPACLIADLALPDMQIATLLGELKSKGLAVPTILMSGDAEIGSTVDAMRAGAVTCIEKPYLARFLVDQVSPLIDDALPAPSRPSD